MKRAAATASRKRAPATRASSTRSARSLAQRLPFSTVSWRYRTLEMILSGTLVAALFLGVLGRLALEAAPGLLVASLVLAAIASVGLLIGIERARKAWTSWPRHAVNAACLGAVAGLAWVVPPGQMLNDLEDLLASERATQLRVIRHQVFAAYRRMDLADRKKILERATVYLPTIEEAAKAFGLDDELMVGIASTESSFHPRPSRDGGRGLFQITVVPDGANAEAKKALETTELDPLNQRHNAFVAAATLKLYAEQMDGDLLLTLLAYNIGPQNGGLRFIMNRYGARNFSQIQPYLQTLPRDYPIRVLSSALAYRIWRRMGELPRYEEGDRAQDLQRIGVPGLDSPGWIERFLTAKG